MSFLEPLFLLGLLAAGLPILVHLMNRRKAVKVPFAAMRLLKESNERSARSVKIRQWLLMAARILAMLLLALALAKPFFLSEEGLAEDERMPTAAVIVLDQSASMQRGDWWEDGKASALERVSSARPWDELTYMPMDQSEPGVRRDAERGEVVRALKQARVSDERGDLPAALATAAALLKASELPQRRITLVTDTAGMSELLNGRLDLPLGVPVELLDVRAQDDQEGGAVVVPNLGVVEVTYEQDGSEASLWRLSARVKNYGPAPSAPTEARLVLDGEVIGASRLDPIAPGEEAEQLFTHRQEGQLVAPARVELIAPDDYAADDVHHFVFRTRARLNALLVNGETSSEVEQDEMFFLSRALNPGRSTTEGIIPRVISPDGLSGEDLSQVDAVILANVPRLSPASAAKLKRYVEEGGGVMFFAGDQVDVEAYNASLSELLPKPLRAIKQLAQRGDPDAPVKVTRLGVMNPKHPIFRAFALPGGETLQSAEVYSYMLFDPTATGDSRRVLAFKDNAPALLERQVGKGRVLFFAISADLEWTTLPIRSAYVPLTQRAVQYLARRSSNRGERGVHAGEAVKFDVEGLVQQRAILIGPLDSPDSARHVLEPRDGEITFTPPRAGVYQVWAESEEPGEGAALKELTFAVNVAPQESDLRGVDPEAFQAWLDAQQFEEQSEDAADARRAQGGPISERRVNIWPKLLFVFTLLLLFETLLGTRRSLIGRVFGGRATLEK